MTDPAHDKWSDEAVEAIIIACVMIPAMLLAAAVGVWTGWKLYDVLGWLGMGGWGDGGMG